MLLKELFLLSVIGGTFGFNLNLASVLHTAQNSMNFFGFDPKECDVGFKDDIAGCFADLVAMTAGLYLPENAPMMYPDIEEPPYALRNIEIHGLFPGGFDEAFQDYNVEYSEPEGSSGASPFFLFVNASQRWPNITVDFDFIQQGLCVDLMFKTACLDPSTRLKVGIPDVVIDVRSVWMVDDHDDRRVSFPLESQVRISKGPLRLHVEVLRNKLTDRAASRIERFLTSNADGVWNAFMDKNDFSGHFTQYIIDNVVPYGSFII